MGFFDYGKVRDPEFFEENRVPAHSDHRFFASAAEAARGESSFVYSLDGLWKFSYAKNYDSAVKGFEQTDYCCRSWDDIRVPAHIQMEGYDVPQYANVQYPWDGREELVPGEIPSVFNPTASYVKYFTLPASMQGKRVFVCFEGAESGLAVWLNGQYVGYSEDSFTPSTFELTQYLVPGENKLAAQVFKWTASSWCEDQDFFRFSGLYRSVLLYAVPEVHIEDLCVRTLVDDAYENAELSVCVQASGVGRAKLRLMDGAQEVCAWEEALSGCCDAAAGNDGCTSSAGNGDCGAAAGNDGCDAGCPQGMCCVMSSVHVAHPELWSAEHPKLYELWITVEDAQGETVEVVRQNVGFRRFEMKDTLMLINGKRIVFRGANRHDFSSLRGRAVTYEETERDIITMKRNNINAIRTSHYPNHSFLYDLCDKYGLYMIDETNMESHGSWDPYAREKKDWDFIVPNDRDEWKAMMLDRANSMYQRDKNHPAIVIWSCGNESFGGSVIYEMSQQFRRQDPTRLVHYEGVKNDRRYNGSSDMESQMYTPADEIREFLKNDRSKPFICCEYLHAMGNSCGAMYKYTDLTDEEPLYQGGFIWDYIDQSITKKDRYGHEFEAYGGDFGEHPCDYNFSGNGIAYGGPGREESPKMQTVKYNYQSLQIFPSETEVLVKNKNLFTDSSEYECVATLARDGREIDSRVMDAAVAPLSEGTFALPFGKAQEPGEYAVTVSFRLKEDTLWAQRGYEVAFGQYVYEVEQAESCQSDGLCSVLAHNLALADAHVAGSYIRPVDAYMSGSYARMADTCMTEPNIRPADAAGAPKVFVVSRGKSNFGVRGEHFEVLFSYLNSGLVSYRYGGKEMLKNIPMPEFWRAPLDNDAGNGMMSRYAQWKTASLYPTPEGSPSVEVREDCAIVTYTYRLATVPAAYCRMEYTVYGDGTVQTKLIYDAVKELGDMPVFGVSMKVDADYDQLEWYGMGPQETYNDRETGAKLGVYRNEVSGNLSRYLVPQECGNHTGVRWAKVTDKRGRGLVFTGDRMEFCALPYTAHELENAAHAYELPPVHYTVIRASLGQMGVGGDNSWGARTHEEYLLKAEGRMEFTFCFRGI